MGPFPKNRESKRSILIRNKPGNITLRSHAMYMLTAFVLLLGVLKESFF